MRLVPWLAGAALVLSTAPPAVAETWSAPDPVGDVNTAYFTDDPPPCGSVGLFGDSRDKRHDIVELAVSHSATDVVLEMHLRRHRPRDLFAEFHVKVPGHRLVVEAGYFEDYVSSEVYLADEPPPPDPDEIGPCGDYGYASTLDFCRGGVLEHDFAAAVIRVTMPRRCLGKPDWVRVGGNVQGAEKSYPSDAWSRKPGDRGGYVPPYGPKVRPDSP